MTFKKLFTFIICLAIIAGGSYLVYAKTHPATPPHHISPSSSTDQSSAPSKPPKPSQLACIKQLPDSLKIGQKIMVAGYADSLDSRAASLASNHIGGIIAMNAIPASTIRSFKKAFLIAPLVATDQEGGTVQRYTGEGILPGAAAITHYTAEQAYQKYLTDDQYLKGIGITTNFAPVLGVKTARHDPLPGRMYSTAPDTVTAYARAAVKAAQATGITPVVKHFPGLGTASGNTDFGAASTAPFSQLQQRDTKPYRDLSSLHPDVMVGNMTVPGLTTGPASLSKAAITGQLRDHYGYKDSVVYTDSLTAQAIPGTLDNDAIMAWQAGADIALIVQTRANDQFITTHYLTTIISNATAALKTGRLSRNNLNASVKRILQRKHIDACQLVQQLPSTSPSSNAVKSP